MKLLILLAALCSSAFAQFTPFTAVNTSQSESGRDWFEINTDRVRLIFPEDRKGEAQDVANLINYYSDYVGDTYKINPPDKFPLVLRPGMALPNGFVTLAPRRSEWFTHETYIPFVGGLGFYDALSIHEYRHIIQYDFSLRSTNRFAYFVLGESGLAIMNFIGLPNWYFEGDAVWAETYHTQGGRGRSPRFSARLKAMILSGIIPTYDELIGKSYNTDLPNHYVYGYYFIARGYEKYGEDFWEKVVDYVTKFAINPYRIYHAFERYAGIDFDVFVRETFEELRIRWEREGDKLDQATSRDYTRVIHPMMDGADLYFLKKGLNEYWGLYKKGVSEAIDNFPIRPDYSKTDLKAGRFVYTQVLPDLRYGYRGYSDLFVYNLKSQDTEQWSEDKRIYHPQWSPSGNMLAFVEYKENGKWAIGLKSAASDPTRYIEFKEVKPFEIAWSGEEVLFVLVQDKLGKRAVHKLNLRTRAMTNIISPTRNNLYALRADGDDLYFEGDWKGRVQIFKFNSQLFQCSDEVVAAYTPIAANGELYYTVEMANGQRLKKRRSSQCSALSLSDFLGKERLTGSSPTDSLTKTTSLEIEDKIFTPQHEITEYSETTGGMSPHSWSFIGSDGFQLSVTGNNYLGTLAWTAAIGYDGEQSKPFANFAMSYSKFFPVFSLYSSLRQREYDYLGSNGPDIDWTEKEAGLKVTLPFQWVEGFYSYDLQLVVDSGLIDASSESTRVSDDQLTYHSAQFTWAMAKEKTLRQIYSPLALSLRGFYRTATSKNGPSFDSDITFARANFFMPGLFENHGVKLSATYQGQTKGLLNYRHEPVEISVSEYTLSRGYNYSYVDSFTKFSFDYALPVMDPDFDLAGWAYIRRIYATPFYDLTNYEILGSSGSLTSYGLEAYMESTLLRRIPLTLGARYSYREDYEDFAWDFIIGTNFSY